MSRKAVCMIVLICAVGAMLLGSLIGVLIVRDRFVAAAWDGDGQKVRAALQRHPGLAGTRNFAGYSALHASADHGHTDIVKALLEAGANPDVRDRKRRTPVHFAARSGHLNVLAALVGGGADVRLHDNADVTPLHLAVQSGDPEMVGRLIAAGADPAARDKRGYTPLHYMGLQDANITSEAGKIVGLLKGSAAGQLLDLTGHDGNTALHLAARLRNPLLTEALVAAGAGINIRSGNGQTPLHISLTNAGTSVPIFLAKNGADLKAADNTGALPIHLAAAVGDIDVIDASLHAGVSIEARDAVGSTPLLHAARHRQYDLFNGLLTRGADRNARNTKGNTALHEAVNEVPDGELTHAWLFIDAAVSAGLNINATNELQETPLHVAARAGHLDYIQSLVDHGADVRLRNRDGATALHLAISNAARQGERVSPRLKEVTEALLRHHAGINVRDRIGRTPLHLAADAGNREMCRFLVGQGANARIRDLNGRTPFQTAGWRRMQLRLVAAYGLMVLTFAEMVWFSIYDAKRRKTGIKASTWLLLLGTAIVFALISWRAEPRRILEYGLVSAPAISLTVMADVLIRHIKKTSERKARLFRGVLIASGVAIFVGTYAFCFTKLEDPPMWLTWGLGYGLLLAGIGVGKENRDSGNWKPPAWREPLEPEKVPEESSGEVQ